MTWNMLVLGHRLAPLRWLPEQRCRPAPAALHLLVCTCLGSYCTLHTFLPGMSLREHCNRSCPGRAGRWFDARGGLILRSSRHACRLPLSSVLLYPLLRLLLVDITRRLAG